MGTVIYYTTAIILNIFKSFTQQLPYFNQIFDSLCYSVNNSLIINLTLLDLFIPSNYPLVQDDFVRSEYRVLYERS